MTERDYCPLTGDEPARPPSLPHLSAMIIEQVERIAADLARKSDRTVLAVLEGRTELFR